MPSPLALFAACAGALGTFDDLPRSRSWGSRRSYGESLAQARARRSMERAARRAKKARRRAVRAARRIQRSHR